MTRVDDKSAPAGSRRKNDQYDYDGFISYSQLLDTRLAHQLQSDIERFGKSWRTPRARRLFRDTASLSASPDLWKSIKTALASSRWFVLLASPESAQSPWVQREIDWWLSHHGCKNIAIVLTKGDNVWDEDSKDRDIPSNTASLSASLLAAFAQPPLFIDLRPLHNNGKVDRRHADYDDAVATIASAVSDVSKDELSGSHIRLHRRSRRLLKAGITVLTMLLIVSLVALTFAIIRQREADTERDIAVQQERISTARQLAASSVNLSAANMQQALPLAVEAYRMNPDAQTESALYRVTDASPHLVSFLDAGSDITATAGTLNASTLIAGTASGDMYQWHNLSHSRSLIGTLPAPISSISTDTSGSVIAAAAVQGQPGPATDGYAAVWDAAGEHLLPLPPGFFAQSVAVSPNGRNVVIVGPSHPGSIALIIDWPAGTSRSIAIDFDSAFAVATANDSSAVIMQEYSGQWSNIAFGSSTVVASGSLEFGAYYFGFAISRDGQYTTYTNGSETVPLVRLGQSDIDHPAKLAPSPTPVPSDMALSDDGTQLAESVDGTIYVGQSYDPNGAPTPPIELSGSGPANAKTLHFLDRRYLISGAGTSIGVWDLQQYSLTGTSFPAEVPFTCGACVRPNIAVSPSGSKAFIYARGGGDTTVVDLSTQTSREMSHEAFPSAAVWMDDDHLWTYTEPVGSSPGEVAIRSGHLLSNVDFSMPVPLATDSFPIGVVISAVLDQVGRSIYVLDYSGSVLRYNIDTRCVSISAGILGNAGGAAALDTLGDRYIALTDESPEPGAAGPSDTKATRLRIISSRSDAVVRDTLMEGQIEYAFFVPGGGVDLVDRTSISRYDIETESRIPLMAGIDLGSYPLMNGSGSLIVHGGSREPVFLTDPNLGTRLMTVPVSMGPKSWTSFGFTASGDKLILATPGTFGPPTVRAISVGAVGRISAACEAAGRNLTPEEWARFSSVSSTDDLICASA